MTLPDWHHLVQRHFVGSEYRIFVPERGIFEKAAKKIAVRLDPYRSVWRAARLLGGTLAAACRKEGDPVHSGANSLDRFEQLLACPDCGGAFARHPDERIVCQACGYEAERVEGVYNLLRSADRAELYPGDREDTVDMSVPGHEARLRGGWHPVEGVHGNRYRWIGARAGIFLRTLRNGPQRLRIRGFRAERPAPTRLALTLNGSPGPSWVIDRPGLFVLEAELPEALGYEIQIDASPVFTSPPDVREFSVNLSLIRLLPPR
jgi:hypothetical protein